MLPINEADMLKLKARICPDYKLDYGDVNLIDIAIRDALAAKTQTDPRNDYAKERLIP